jgi:hypothetical protein
MEVVKYFNNKKNLEEGQQLSMIEKFHTMVDGVTELSTLWCEQK